MGLRKLQLVSNKRRQKMAKAVQQKSKAQKAAAATSGGKAKKKKWSKGKVREKANNRVIFDKATWQKVLKEVPTHKVNGALARRAIREMLNRKLIRLVSAHGDQII